MPSTVVPPPEAIEKLRQMTSAWVRPTLDEVALTMLLRDAATVDDDGRLVTDDGWVPTYAFNQAAAAAWELKAGQIAADFNFSADNASYSKGDVMAKCLEMAAMYRAKGYGVITLSNDRDRIYDSPRLIL